MADWREARVAAIQNVENKSGSNRSRLLEPEILHTLQPFVGQRALWKSFEFQWRANFIAQNKRYRTLLTKVDDPTVEVRNIDLEQIEEEVSVHLYFALVKVMPQECREIGGHERQPRRLLLVEGDPRNQGQRLDSDFQ